MGAAAAAGPEASTWQPEPPAVRQVQLWDDSAGRHRLRQQAASTRQGQSHLDCEPELSLAAATVRGAVTGAMGGLVAGIVWGIIQEKKFVFRNMAKDYHLREPPITLFPIMTRGITTSAVGAAFLGSLAALRWALHPHALQDARHPALAAGAGTMAGAVRSALSEVSLHPLIHAQRSMTSGLFAAGVFACGPLLEEQHRQHEQQLRQQQQQQQQQQACEEGAG